MDSVATRKSQLEATTILESGEIRRGRGVAEAQEFRPLDGGWVCGQPTYWMLTLQRVEFFSRNWDQGGEAPLKQRDRERVPWLLLSSCSLITSCWNLVRELRTCER